MGSCAFQPPPQAYGSLISDSLLQLSHVGPLPEHPEDTPSCFGQTEGRAVSIWMFWHHRPSIKEGAGTGVTVVQNEDKQMRACAQSVKQWSGA